MVPSTRSRSTGGRAGTGIARPTTSSTNLTSCCSSRSARWPYRNRPGGSLCDRAGGSAPRQGDRAGHAEVLVRSTPASSAATVGLVGQVGRRGSAAAAIGGRRARGPRPGRRRRRRRSRRFAPAANSDVPVHPSLGGPAITGEAASTWAQGTRSRPSSLPLPPHSGAGAEPRRRPARELDAPEVVLALHPGHTFRGAAWQAP